MKSSIIKLFLGIFIASLFIFADPSRVSASVADVWGCFYNKNTGQGINDVWILWVDSGDSLWQNSPGQCNTPSGQGAECQTHRPHRRYVKTFKNDVGYSGRKCGTDGSGTFYFPSWGDSYPNDAARASIANTIIDSDLNGSPDTYQARYNDECSGSGCSDPARDSKGFSFDRGYGFNCSTEKNSFQAVHPATLVGGTMDLPVWIGSGTESGGVSNVPGVLLQTPDLFWNPPAQPQAQPVTVCGKTGILAAGYTLRSPSDCTATQYLYVDVVGGYLTNACLNVPAGNTKTADGCSYSPNPAATTLQCLNIKIYDTNGTQITSPATQIKSGDTVTIAVSATTNDPGGITKARFKINGGAFQETTTKNASNEYYIQTTVAPGQFSVEGEIFNPTLGWK